MIFTCPQCGTENDVGISPNYGSIANCGRPTCAGQEAFTGFPQILTSPQDPETAKPEHKPGPVNKSLTAIGKSYVNILVAIVLNLISAALISLVAYYAVRSAIEKQIPAMIEQEKQKTAAPQK